MATPNAIYGFATGRDWRTGAELTGWDYVWYSLDVIPVAGVFAKTFKNGIKGLKVYNKTTGAVFDVIQAAKKMPANIASKLSSLQQKGMRIVGSIEDELILVVNSTNEQLLKIKNKVVEILNTYTTPWLEPEWTLSLGNMQVKINGDILDEVVEVQKFGNELRIVSKIGNYDAHIIRRYFQHIQEVTKRAVPQVQINELKNALRSKEYIRLSDSETAIHRADFNSRKNQIIADWETHTGQQWPTYTESVYSKNGVELRKPGDKYDAHHIIENKYGGDNEWWNMHPAKFPDEHQGGIHGAGSPSRLLFN